MKKFALAAAACAALLASQAVADTDSVNLGDRVGADSSTSSSFDGMSNMTIIYFLLAAAAIGGAAYAISEGNSSPTSP